MPPKKKVKAQAAQSPHAKSGDEIGDGGECTSTKRATTPRGKAKALQHISSSGVGHLENANSFDELKTSCHNAEYLAKVHECTEILWSDEDIGEVKRQPALAIKEEGNKSQTCSHTAPWDNESALTALTHRHMYDTAVNILQTPLANIAQEGVPINEFGMKAWRKYHWGVYPDDPATTDLQPLDLKCVIAITPAQLADAIEQGGNRILEYLRTGRNLGPIEPRHALLFELNDVRCNLAKQVWWPQWCRLIRSAQIRVIVLSEDSQWVKSVAAHQDLKADFASCRRTSLMIAIEHAIFAEKEKMLVDPAVLFRWHLA